MEKTPYFSVDWITYTSLRYLNLKISESESDWAVVDRLLDYMFSHMQHIYGATPDKVIGGKNFYEKGFSCERNGLPCGEVHFGGNTGTWMVIMSGDALKNAQPFWDYRLRTYCDEYTPNITRIDCAMDLDWLTIDEINDDYIAGKILFGNRRPDCHRIGDWDNGDKRGMGRTIYIGKRTSAKMIRVYEKGKQLGDKNSNWLRIEAELKPKNGYELDYDAIIHPQNFIAGVSPYFAELTDCHYPKNMNYRKKEIISNLNKRKAWFEKTCLPTLALLHDKCAEYTDLNLLVEDTKMVLTIRHQLSNIIEHQKYIDATNDTIPF